MYHSMIFTSLNPIQVPTSRTSRLSAYSAMKTFQEEKSTHMCNIKVITDGTARVKEETAIVVMVNVFMAMWST